MYLVHYFTEADHLIYDGKEKESSLSMVEPTYNKRLTMQTHHGKMAYSMALLSHCLQLYPYVRRILAEHTNM